MDNFRIVRIIVHINCVILILIVIMVKKWLGGFPMNNNPMEKVVKVEKVYLYVYMCWVADGNVDWDSGLGS